MIKPGTRFGKWVVLDGPTQIRGRNRYYHCSCDCGNKYWVQQGNLKNRNGSCKPCALKKTGRQRRRLGLEPAATRTIHRYKYAAKKRGLEWSLDFGAAAQVLTMSCVYCGAPPGAKFKYRDSEILYTGIDRVDNKKGYVNGNIVPCCSICNKAKNDLSFDIWKEWIARLVAYQTLKVVSKSS